MLSQALTVILFFWKPFRAVGRSSRGHLPPRAYSLVRAFFIVFDRTGGRIAYIARRSQVLFIPFSFPFSSLIGKKDSPLSFSG